MKDLVINLSFLFRPNYWLMNEKYSKAHNIELKRLMASYKFSNVKQYTAILGNTEIWIANYPYAVGIRSISGISRPSRLTIFKMRKKLIHDTIAEKLSIN